MTNAEKFHRMISLLSQDDGARQRLLSDPSGLLRDLGIDPSVLHEPHDQDALQRAKDVLHTAGIQETDDAITSLTKLGVAAKAKFGNFSIDVDPLGVTLLERPTKPASLDITATGTTKCTFSPWDGCKPDVDY